MHPFTIPPEISARVAARCGTPHPFATLVGPRTALVVVDMQNAFMDPALGHAVCAMAPAIVPAVNRLATATRAAGGGVFWIQTVHDESDDRDWAVMQAMMTPAARARRVAALTRNSAGYALWSGMDVRPEDERVEKHRFSAFIQGSGALRHAPPLRHAGWPAQRPGGGGYAECLHGPGPGPCRLRNGPSHRAGGEPPGSGNPGSGRRGLLDSDRA